MRISDWSSDVCSSDLHSHGNAETRLPEHLRYDGQHRCLQAEGAGFHEDHRGHAFNRGRKVQRLYRPCRSEEHTSELQSLMRISYAVFCLKKKKTPTQDHTKIYNIK